MTDCGFKGKVAVVTGAGGDGIGPAACRLFASNGAKVVASCIHRSEAEKTVEEVKALGGKAIATCTDVTKLEDCYEMVRQAPEAFGRVDILVTVPAWTSLKPFIEETVEEWHKAMNITFWGAVHAVRAVLPSMMKQKGGSIILLGSDTTKLPGPLVVIYDAAKTGLNLFALGLAKEIGPHGIRINVVSMGTTKTPKGGAYKGGWITDEREKMMAKQYPLGRLVEIDDVVNAIAFLASERASFITGQVLSVNGGLC